jgi:hypothetical protein
VLIPLTRVMATVAAAADQEYLVKVVMAPPVQAEYPPAAPFRELKEQEALVAAAVLMVFQIMVILQMLMAAHSWAARPLLQEAVAVNMGLVVQTPTSRGVVELSELYGLAQAKPEHSLQLM